MALLVDRSLTSTAIPEEVRKLKDPLLSHVQLFDLYEGKGVEAGKKSLAYSLTFASSERTLTDAEVDASVGKIVQHLEKTLGAKLRA